MSAINSGSAGCRMKCWSLAAVIGLLVAILLIALSGKSVVAGLFLGLLSFALPGLLFTWLFCAEVPQSRPVTHGVVAAEPSPPTPAEVAPTEPAAVAPAAIDSPALVPAASPDAAVLKPSKPLAGQQELASRKGVWRFEAEAPSVPATDAPPPKPATPAAPSAEIHADGGLIKPSKALPGQADLAARRGSWRYQPG